MASGLYRMQWGFDGQYDQFCCGGWVGKSAKTFWKKWVLKGEQEVPWQIDGWAGAGTSQDQGRVML